MAVEPQALHQQQAFTPPLGKIIPTTDVINKRLYLAHDMAPWLELSAVELPEDFDLYIDDLAIMTPRGTPGSEDTIRLARDALARFTHFMNLPPEKIQSKHIRECIRKATKHGYPPTTTRGIFDRLKAFYNHQFTNDAFYPCPYCGSTEHKQVVFSPTITAHICQNCNKNLNPVQGVKLPKPEPRNDPIYSLHDVNLSLNLLPYLVMPNNVLLFEGLIRTLLETAVRIRKEALGLGLNGRVPNYIDLENCELVLTTTKGKRRLQDRRPISTRTRDVILEHAYNMKQRGLEPQKRVFDICYYSVWRLFKSLQVNADLNKIFYPHLSRATFATTFWEKYHSEEALKRAGGWSSDAYKAYLRVPDTTILEMSRDYVREKYDIDTLKQNLAEAISV